MTEQKDVNEILQGLRCDMYREVCALRACKYQKIRLDKDFPIYCNKWQVEEDAATLIEEQKRIIEATKVPKWISVKDRLPETYENVLVCENNEVLLAYWNGKEWCQCDLYEYVTLYPTYWMPLPEPPKEETEAHDEQPIS